ncbi:TPA: DUF799 domain-containing protein [Proteus mirabilis]|nr:DUF799 domain-containing protein [Proteus mirabilis]
MNRILTLVFVVFAFVLSGCAEPVKTDYTAFKASKPKSILVLLPKNQTPEVEAAHSFLSQVTYPLAEAGYYVFPVAVVEETFKQNGLSTGSDIQAVSPSKLREIFGADSVLYLDVTQYGTSYQVIASETRVSASASSAEGDTASNGLVGMLVSAVVTQIVDTIADKSHEIAGVASVRLLSAGHANGILYGPRSPHYEKEGQ